MFQIGDYVVESNAGICHIEDILHLDGFGIDKKKLYYSLVPMSDDKTKIYIPVDSTSNLIRKASNSEEAWSIIKSISKIEAIHIEDERQRENKYKEALKSNNPIMLIKIIKTMFLRQQKRTNQGKKNTIMDDRYFKLAEDFLYSELAFAIGKDKKDMRQIISDTIKNDRP